jgi:hypothetical protein
MCAGGTSDDCTGIVDLGVAGDAMSGRRAVPPGSRP